jgi:hypothetical protein
MNPSTITIEATLLPDGQTLQLEKKLALPPGRVTVTLQTTGSPSGPTMLEVLDRIHQEQRQRGRVPMSEEQMDAEIAQLRAEADEEEERWREIWSQTKAPDKRTDTP